MEEWRENAGAILHGWYGGEQTGAALAAVMFGDSEPGGRLPLTVPRFVGQCPVTHDMKPSGRGHSYEQLGSSGSIRYPFGHGLGYTHFEFSNLSAKHALSPVEGIQISLKLQNRGDCAGRQLVQIYFRDPLARVTRPLKQLAAWRWVSLGAGAEEMVLFEIPLRTFEYLDEELAPVIDEGEIQFFAGASATDIRLEQSIWIPARQERA